MEAIQRCYLFLMSEAGEGRTQDTKPKLGFWSRVLGKKNPKAKPFKCEIEVELVQTWDWCGVCQQAGRDVWDEGVKLVMCPPGVEIARESKEIGSDGSYNSFGSNLIKI